MELVLKLLAFINMGASGHGSLVFGIVRTCGDKVKLVETWASLPVGNKCGPVACRPTL